MTSEKTTLAQEITKLVARGILVVNRRHAMSFADNLAEFLSDDYQRPPRDWHVVSIKAFNDAGPLIVDGIEEVERVYEEILDFYDRLAAGYINQDSIHLITVNAEADSAFQWGLPTIALIGNWEPEMNVTVPGEAEYREWQSLNHLDSSKPLVADTVQNETVLRFINGVTVAEIEEGMLTLEQTTGRLYEQVMTGLIKPVTRWLPNDDAVQAAENLKGEMPHLGEFWDEVLTAMKLVIRLNATRFTLPSMILVGPPGVGKTFALFSLAEALDLSMESIPMSTTGAGFILSGSERGWREPVPGLLAKSAAKSRHINPIFILDEFEKATFKRNNGMNGLEPEVLQMLERDSAKRFRDVFLEQDLNLSEISYIGSANTTHQIPKPILSRVKIIEVGYPPVESLQQIYTSILNKALQEDFGIEGLTVMVSRDIKQLATSGLSPRLVRNNAGKILANALHLAASDECIRISGADLVNLIKSTTNSRPRGIGFLAAL